MIALYRATLDGLLAQALDRNGGGDASEVYFECFADPAKRWNGFACPYFSKEQIEAMCPSLVIEGVLLSWRWGDDGSLVTVCPEDPDEIDEWPATRIETHPEPVWPFGSGGWTWLLENDFEESRTPRIPEGLFCIDIDGVPCTVAEFYERNHENLDPDEMIAVLSLAMGKQVTLGGGAFASFVIKRIQ